MSDTAPIVENNGYAAIRLMPSSVQILAWYTPPWLDRIIQPIVGVGMMVLGLWVMFRMALPPIAQFVAPSFDALMGSYVALFQGPIGTWMGSYNYELGREMSFASLAGNMTACILLFALSKLFEVHGMAITSQFVRFPLRVEIRPDAIRIGRRAIKRNGNEGFSLENTGLTRNKRFRTEAYNQSMRVILETGIQKVKVAEVFGIERAEAITLALQEAIQRYARN